MIKNLSNELEKEQTSIKKEVASLRIETENLRRETEYLRNETEYHRNETEYLRGEYVKVLYSKSYRITAPLRTLYTLLAKVRGRIRTFFPSRNSIAESPGMDLLNDQVIDEEYFLNLLKREASKRRNSKEAMDV